MINVAELLKSCPKGTKLWCPLFGPVTFIEVGVGTLPIIVEYHGSSSTFDKYGRFFCHFEEGECVLFPSKDCRTWEGWKAPVDCTLKVGDWIVPKSYNGEMPRQIVKKLDTVFVLDDGTAYICKDAQEYYRLWTIADAKDGDMLTDGKLIVIFNKFEEPSYKQHIIAHIGLDLCGRLQITEDTWQLGVDKAMPATKEQRFFLLKKIQEAGYQWDADKRELRKVIEPNFKVGDWIVHTDGNSDVPIQVYGLKEDRYLVTNMLGTKGEFMITNQGKWRFWTIEDAKDGDVLTAHEVIVLFKEIDGLNIRCHFSYHYMNTPMVFTNELHNKMAFRPATKDECELLFAKMKEERYQWYAGKKDLKKIQSHYDITNFYAGMPVLVRDDDDEEWNYLFFSHYRKKSSDHFFAGGNPWFQCIPFGEDTKHLLGTTDMCDEQYVNW